MMITVWLCTFPAMFFGMWNVGYQANTILAGSAELMAAQDGWRIALTSALAGLDPASLWANFLHGATYFLPIYLTTFIVGGFWEVLFAAIRRHEVNEGFFVTSVLFALTCPPDIPLWQVALGISFGVVIGKEVFGGTGKNFLNPALPAAPSLLRLSGADVGRRRVDRGGWLHRRDHAVARRGRRHRGGGRQWHRLDERLPRHGARSIGETSTLAILIGGAVLLS